MPIFEDPHFPRPGQIPKRRDSNETRKPNPAPTLKPTSPPSPRAPVRAAVQAVPLKVKPLQQRKPLQESRAKTSWPELVLFAFLIFTGLAVMSTILGKKLAEKKIKQALVKAVAPLEQTATFSFGRVSLGLLKGTLQVRDIDITMRSTGENIHIDKVSVWGVDHASMKQMLLSRKPVLPRTLRMSAGEVTFAGETLGPRGQALLLAMGYPSLRLSTSLSVHFDRAQRSFSLDDLRLQVTDVGQFNLSFALGSLTLPGSKDLAQIKKDPKKLLDADLTKIEIKSFDLSFTDDSLVNRALEAMRKLPGETSPVTLVEMALAMNGGRGPASKDVDFVKPALEKLHDFLQNPQSISLSAHPDQPIPLMSLLDEKTGSSINELAHRLKMRVD